MCIYSYLNIRSQYIGIGFKEKYELVNEDFILSI